MAEIYNILDYRALPVKTLAALCSGLRPESRTMMKIAGMQYSLDTLLRAMAVDRLSLLLWSKTKDAEKGRNKPKSILNALLGKECEETKTELETFETVEEYEEYKRELLKEIKNE